MSLDPPTPEQPADTPAWQRALVLALLRPAVRLCRRFRLPLKTLEDLARLAYFESLRQGGRVPQAEVARLTGVSLRTVVALERQAREGIAATAEERALQRHIEESLGREGGQTAAGLADHFETPVEVMDRMLAALTAEGRVIQDGPAAQARYRIDPRFVSLVSTDRAARLDGLNHQLDVLGAAVEGRFLRSEGRSMARTFTFVATPQALDALLQTLPQHFRASVIATEEASIGECAEGESARSGGQQTYGATFAIGPMGPAGQTEDK